MPERGDLERRDVHEPGARPRDALERAEQLVDRPGPRALGQDALADELADERVEVGARAARDVGRGGEDPERREAEGRDRAELDHVAGALADGEATGIRLVLVRDGRLRRDAAHELDRDPEQVLRRRLVEPRAPDDARQGELERLVERPADRRRDRAHGALGQAEQEGDATHGR